MSEPEPAAEAPPRRSVARRLIWYAVLVGVFVFGYVTGRNPKPKPPEPCGDADAQLAAIWAPSGRVATLASAAAPQIDAQVAAYESRWAASRLTACTAHRAGALSTPQRDARLACLDRGRAALASIAASARARAPLDELVRAAASLPDLSACD